MCFTVRVCFADGDDFTRLFSTVVQVQADSDRDATLVAAQFVSATRCDQLHLQLVDVEILEVLV